MIAVKSLMEKEACRTAHGYIVAHRFLNVLKRHSEQLTGQEYKTLRGQAIAGDVEGATRGLETILKRRA